MPSKMSSSSGPAVSEFTARTIEVINKYRGSEGPLLPILHAVQAEFGYVPPETLTLIAHELNISRADIHGVVTFYHDYRLSPAGRHVVKLCRAEACQSVGGDAIAAAAKRLLGVDWNETSADGQVTLEPVYCLGLCACAPAAMVDGELVGRLDEARLTELVAEVRS